MSTYVKTRESVLTLRDALHPGRRKRKSEDKGASAFDEDRRRMRALFSDPNLLGFGVAEKIVGKKKIAREFSVTFFVRRKLPKARLRSESFIPKRLRVEGVSSVIQTDVKPLGTMHVAHGGLNCGTSIGHISGTAGTVTLIAKDVTTQKQMILSCSHVLARAGAAQQGDAIESPAFPGSGNSPQIVGSLTNRFMVIDPQVYNTIDAALALPVDGIALSNNIPGLGDISGAMDLSGMVEGSAMNLPVAKFGAATELQSGLITGTDFTVQIRFPELGDRVVWFTGLLTHNIPSEQGDSGAAVVETGGMNVVGMHIANVGESGLCTNIRPIFEIMQISL